MKSTVYVSVTQVLAWFKSKIVHLKKKSSPIVLCGTFTLLV